MRKFFIGLVAFAAGLCLMAGTSFAYRVSSNMHVYVDVQTSCGLTTPDLDFGAYHGENLSQSHTITVRCNVSGVPFVVSANAGQNYSGSGNTRGMNDFMDTANTTIISYYLYWYDAAAGYYKIWGDTGYGDTHPGSPASGFTSTGGDDTVSLMAYLPSQIVQQSTHYHDWVLVAVNF